MADEIQIMQGLIAEKAVISGKVKAGVRVNSETLKFNWTGPKHVDEVQNIGTTYEAVTTGDLAGAGWAMFANLDSTNYVELGVEVTSTFYPLVKISAGAKAGPFELSDLTFHARANTAAVDMRKVMLDT